VGKDYEPSRGARTAPHARNSEPALRGGAHGPYSRALDQPVDRQRQPSPQTAAFCGKTPASAGGRRRIGMISGAWTLHQNQAPGLLALLVCDSVARAGKQERTSWGGIAWAPIARVAVY
jgi:hypothetical protein